MLKIKIFNLLICFVGSVALVIILFLISSYKTNHFGFIRILPSHLIDGVNSKDLKHNSWYLSGIHNHELFLANSLVIKKVLKIDTNLVDTVGLTVTGLEKSRLFQGSIFTTDNEVIWIMDGLKPSILKGGLPHLRFEKFFKTSFFTGSIPLTENSIALRYINEKGVSVLAKEFLNTNVLKTTDLLEKQIDGIFCTDGEIVKVQGSSKMIYVYYYRNQFLCTDSNLNLLYKGKTIDTISRAQIKVAKIASTGETTMAAPPLHVNKRACANEKYLFVQSSLRANNETEYMIKDVSMIDVYAVADGKYQFSFYLPDFRGFKVRDFKVYGQSLYALYDHYLYKYQLNF
ncbi:hypothetical protein [Pedobacter foliorum]|uniref:hypothetical protein n=1 Tax=Pedobacter foliorum TaxID=2739058 RepID=UPI00156436B1|nr:hypothetical protein [Pedobacter foliorum]NRF37586.1 hypothetical protein [Pedobacter foliorum]